MDVQLRLPRAQASDISSISALSADVAENDKNKYKNFVCQYTELPGADLQGKVYDGEC